MTILTGSTRKKVFVRQLQQLGWGRMFVFDKPCPYDGEPWGFDNGAFVHWRRGEAFNENEYAKRLERAANIGTPYMAVIPDVVGDAHKTMMLSMKWLYKMPKDWPLYFAVQDGMTFQDVILTIQAHPRIKGLFLGGTNTFKLQAQDWCDLAHQYGKKFHYARAGIEWKIDHACRVNADSLDSSFPLWKQSRWQEFVDICTGNRAQKTLITVE